MKKPKRPIKWEEDEEESSERTVGESEETAFDLSGDTGIGLEGFDEEEIIDLEDIIELSEDDQQEGTLGLDVELLDVEPDLDDAGDLYSAKIVKETEDDSFGDDLLKDFSLAEEESLRMDPLAGSDMSSESRPGRQETLAKGREDAQREAGVELEGPLEPEPMEEKEKKISPKVEAFGASLPHMEPSESMEDVTSEFETDVLAGSRKSEKIPMAAETQVDELALKEEIRTQTRSIEEFVSQIESRLLEAVRGIVESKLPEVVRTVLQEEIERLKKESP